MLNIKTVSVKNFLSVGNQPIEIKFENGNLILVSGSNGSCKSGLIIDSVFFALYGKAFRKVNRDGLVNSVNRKNMEVTLSFETGGKEYLIKRGIKPNIFEVYVNGILKEPPANIRDYQDWLQSMVLKMDEKTFKQIVVLGSSSYVPFMRLTAADRRTVVEDLLSINVFSTMHELVKKEMTSLTSEVKSTEDAIRGLKLLWKAKNEAAEKIAQNFEQSINDNQAKIEDLESEIEGIYDTITELMEKLDKKTLEEKQSALKTGREIISTLREKIVSIKTDMKHVKKVKDFFDKTSDCPTCGQRIEDELRTEKVNESSKSLEALQKSIDQITDKMNREEEEVKSLQETISDALEEWNAVTKLKTEVKTKTNTIKILKSQIDEFSSRAGVDGEILKAEMMEVVDKILKKDKEATEIKETLEIYALFNSLLRDDGIKLKIIRNYLPLVNNLIKKYLDIMGFDSVTFSFDETFTEDIKSRGRDVFAYGNLSEGEKLRIDMCLLFCWRELTRMKNTVTTNLLVLDEPTRGVMDESGMEAIGQIIKSSIDKDTCIVLISHEIQKFETIATKRIHVHKHGYFTKLKENA